MRALVKETREVLEDHGHDPGLAPVRFGTAQALVGFLDSDLTTRQIANELYVSVDTVRSQVRSIYRKLDASRRNDAVRRARHLRLL